MDLIMETKWRDETQSKLLSSPSFPWAPFWYGEQQVSCEGLWGFNYFFKKTSPSIYLGWRSGLSDSWDKANKQDQLQGKAMLWIPVCVLEPSWSGFARAWLSVPSSSSCVWRLLSTGKLCSAMSVGVWEHDLSGCLLFCCWGFIFSRQIYLVGFVYSSCYQ